MPTPAIITLTRFTAPASAGCFPIGASPYGCEDMSGNVWEWTRSIFAKYPYPERGSELNDREAPEGDSPRVLRGGSFYDYPGRVRCACRHDGGPGYRGRQPRVSSGAVPIFL